MRQQGVVASPHGILGGRTGQAIRDGFQGLVGRVNPLLALAFFSVLGLGITANRAIFSVMGHAAVPSMPYPNAERLVLLWPDIRLPDRFEELTSYPNYLDWKEGSQRLEDLAAFEAASFELEVRGETQPVTGSRVSANFFQLLGVPPALGRTFFPAEDRPGSPPVVVLSHALWRHPFGGDPALLGERVVVDGRSYEVIGVMPPEFQFPLGVKNFPHRVDLWLPLVPSGWERERLHLGVVARLRRGASIAGTQAEMTALGISLQHRYPAFAPGFGVRVESLLDHVLGETQRPFPWVWRPSRS